MTGIANHISITWRLICRRCRRCFPPCIQITLVCHSWPKTPLNFCSILQLHLLYMLCRLFYLWDSGGAQLERDGPQPGQCLPFPHLSQALSLSLCRPQSSTSAARGRLCLVAHFILWRLGLIACLQDQEPEIPCVYKTDCSTKSFTSLEQFTSPFCLSFPVCKSEIMFAFLPGILQGLISWLSLLERWKAFYTW